MAIENIIISDNSLKLIKLGFGYPVIDSEASYLFTDDQIKELIIAPALEEFFTFFPIRVTETKRTAPGTSVTVSFPENFIGLTHYSFVPYASSSSLSVTPTGNPFYTQSLVSSFGAGYGKFGTPFNFGYDLNRYQRKAYYDSLDNANRVWFAEPDYENEELKLYASTAGTFNIVWGLYNNDFDSACPLRKRQELISFTRAKYKRQIGDIIGLGNSGLPTEMDFQKLIDDADAEIERLRLKWSDEVITTVIR